MKFYKDTTTGLFFIGDNILPAGKYKMAFFESDTIISLVDILDDTTHILDSIEITNLSKEGGGFYVDKADLLADVSDFFSSGSGGVVIPGIDDVLAVGQVLTADRVIDVSSNQFNINRISGTETSILQLGGFGIGAWLRTTDSSNGNDIYMHATKTSAIVAAFFGGGGAYVQQFMSSGAIFADTQNFKGYEYAADYSANYTDRSIIDKEYVDSLLYTITAATSDVDSDLAVGINKTRFTMPFGLELDSDGIYVGLGDVPTGSTFITDVQLNGSTILSTLLSVDAGENTSLTANTPPVISTTTLPQGGIITVEYTQVGAINTGKSHTINMTGTKI